MLYQRHEKILFIRKNIAIDRSTVIAVIWTEMLVISPIMACDVLPSGRNKNATASEDAKTTAVRASIGSCVFSSKNQIKIIPKNNF